MLSILFSSPSDAIVRMFSIASDAMFPACSNNAFALALFFFVKQIITLLETARKYAGIMTKDRAQDMYKLMIIAVATLSIPCSKSAV